MTMPLLTPIPRKKPSDDDRRRSERVPHVVESWISSPTDFDKNQQQEVRSVNLSRHGVAFDTDKEMATGAFKIIEIGLGQQRMISEVRIVSCRKTDEGHYEVGAEFC